MKTKKTRKEHKRSKVLSVSSECWRVLWVSFECRRVLSVSFECRRVL